LPGSAIPEEDAHCGFGALVQQLRYKSVVRKVGSGKVASKLNRVSPAPASVDATGEAGHSACLFQSLLRGSVGFAGVSVGGFAVWAFCGGWLHARFGEIGLYLACAAVFIALSGLALHPLVHGPGSLVRFYKIFIPAFGLYVVAWLAAWFVLRFGPGEWLGSLAGSVVLAVMVGRGLGTSRSLVKVSVVLFVLHSAGYFIGGQSMSRLTGFAEGGQGGGLISVLPKLCWGLFYGLGFGAGLGYAFFTFQEESTPTRGSATPTDAPATY
jgi:hypothetical protein